MAASWSPHTPSYQPARNSFSSHNINPVAASPSPLPAGSGIPTFRSLRSLLPFGPNKNASLSVSASPIPTKSPFSGFGSVRRSITKDRKDSFSNDTVLPVIAIDRIEPDEFGVRRSASLSRLDKPLPADPIHLQASPHSLREDVPILRTPSPGPPLSAELSTIIEADTSGVSKHAQDADSNTADLDSSALDLDLSTTHLTTQVLSAMGPQATSAAQEWANADKAVIIDDDDDDDNRDATHSHADESFSLNHTSIDPSLRALLSPNNISSPTPKIPLTSPSLSRTRASLLPRLRTASTNSHTSPSPHSPIFPCAQTPPIPSVFTPDPSPSRTMIIHGDDSLISSPQTPTSASPTRSSMHHVSEATVLPASATSTPARRPLFNSFNSQTPTIALNQPTPRRFTSSTASAARLFGLSSSSPSISTASLDSTDISSRPFTKSPNTNANANTPGIGKGLPTTRLRHSILGPRPSSAQAQRMARTMTSPQPASSSGARASLDVPRPSLESRHAASFDILRSKGSTSPSRFVQDEERSAPMPHRPSIDSTFSASSAVSGISTSTPQSVRTSAKVAKRSVFGITVSRLNRSMSEGVGNEDLSDPSQFSPPNPSNITPNPLSSSSSSSYTPRPQQHHRSRKRSMSVQDRLHSSVSGRRYASSAVADMEEFGGGVRPGSSLSMSVATSSRGARGDTAGPRAEWLGPRTVKAFRAAGLLDFEKDQERGRERSSSDHDDRERERDGERDSTPPSDTRARSGSAATLLSQSPLSPSISPSISASTTSTSASATTPAGGSGLGRFASLRSTSEYNPSRAGSRLAFSEAGTGDGRRRGSGTFMSGHSVNGGSGGVAYGNGYGQGHGRNYSSGGGGRGLMESPTFTASTSASKERDTLKSSASTAPTSVSGSSWYRGEKERGGERGERESELLDLQEKHALETGALLSALSDSQRTVRVLRGENSELRERLDKMDAAADVAAREREMVERENEELRGVCMRLEDDCKERERLYDELRRELEESRASGVPGIGGRWKAGGVHSPIQRGATKRSPVKWNREDEYDFENGIVNEEDIPDPEDEYMDQDEDAQRPASSSPASPSTPVAISKSHSHHHQHPKNRHRRRSTASSISIFPVLPSNMTMLLHDDDPTAAAMQGSNRSSSSSHFRLPIPSSFASAGEEQSRMVSQTHQSPPVSYRGLGHNHSKSLASSIASANNISPTTANFSMVTGSPGSLFLRPEHEALLGEMESLDLGMVGSGGEDEGNGGEWI